MSSVEPDIKTHVSSVEPDIKTSLVQHGLLSRNIRLLDAPRRMAKVPQNVHMLYVKVLSK